MDIFGHKLLIAVAVFAAGIGGGLLPFRMRATIRGERFLKLGHAFAGGVFLGAGMMHLLADSGEHFDEWLINVSFPLAMLLAGVGFLLVLCVERVLVHDVNPHQAHTMKTHPYLLTIVLSIHSLIAGAALGLENSLGALLALFIAVIAHKAFAAFALGVSFHDSAFDPSKARRVLLLFSLMTPIGIVLGGSLGNLLESATALAAEAIFDGVAAGTFVYVATLDIVREAFATGEQRWPKFVWLSLGFGLMGVIALWA